MTTIDSLTYLSEEQLTARVVVLADGERRASTTPQMNAESGRSRAAPERKRSYLVAVLVPVVLAYFAWWVLFSGDTFHTHSANAANRAALVRLHAALHIGAVRSSVLDEYWSQRTPDLRLHVDARDQWVVSMPLEFGANDWTLIIEFRDNVVSAVRVRTTNGPRPPEGPPDKGTPEG